MSPSSSGLNPPDVVQTPTLNEHDYLYSGPEPSAVEMLEAAQMRIAQLEAALEQRHHSHGSRLNQTVQLDFTLAFPPLKSWSTPLMLCNLLRKICIAGLRFNG